MKALFRNHRLAGLAAAALIAMAPATARAQDFINVLTGGTSKLMAVDEAATAVFGVTARRGELPTNLADELRDPQYSTVLGLLFYGLNQINERAPAAYQRRNGGLMERFTRMFANA